MTLTFRQGWALLKAWGLGWLAASLVIAILFFAVMLVQAVAQAGLLVGLMQVSVGVFFSFLLPLLGALIVSFPVMALAGLPLVLVAGEALAPLGARGIALGAGLGFVAGAVATLLMTDADLLVTGGSGTIYGGVTAFFVTRTIHG